MESFKVVRFRSLAAAVALPVLAGACVPDDALTPRVPSTLDAALADLTHPALDVVAATFSGAGLVTPRIVPTRCPFDAASQSFVCTPLTGIGITLTQRFQLLDAAGGRQSAFDSATTTGLHLENAVNGTVVQNATTLMVDGQQTLDLSGLGSARHTLNGSSLTLTTLVDPARADSPPVKREIRTTIADLVIPVVTPGQPRGWPLSGTIDIRYRTDYRRELPGGGTTVVFIATMRFSGSSLVTLTMTVPGGIETCQLDLAFASGLGCQNSQNGRPLS
jgi:hypothetical protein